MLETSDADRRSTLTVGEYDHIFRVLEDCDSPTTLSAFREAVPEALARHLGLHHTTFFAGPSMATVWMDPSPTIVGMTRSMLGEYQNGWYKHDVFRSDAASKSLKARRIAATTDLGDLSEHGDRYMREFLNRGGIVAGYALALDVALSHLGIVGVFLEEMPDARTRSSEVLGVLVGPLNALSRGLKPEQPAGGPRRPWQLAPRHWEVAMLVAEGMSNREIAQRLSISDDTVKKYVSAVLEALRCSSRTQAALILREGTSPGSQWTAS